MVVSVFWCHEQVIASLHEFFTNQNKSWFLNCFFIKTIWLVKKIKSILNFEFGIGIFENARGEPLIYYRTIIESKLQTKKMPLNFKGICIFVAISVISNLNEKSNSKFTYWMFIRVHSAVMENVNLQRRFLMIT